MMLVAAGNDADVSDAYTKSKLIACKTKRESSAEHEQKLLQGTADYPGMCLWVQYIRILYVQYCLNLTKGIQY